MRRSVPFIGEDFIQRDSNNADAPKQNSIIDEVLGAETGNSSWDEVVSNWPSRVASEARASVSVSRPAAPKSNTPMRKVIAAGEQRAHIDWKPINNGHCLRISVNGNMDLALRNEWHRLLREVSTNGIGQFEFNLTQTPELSLTGLGMLLLFKEYKKSQRQDIKLCHCNQQIRELLQWTGMEKYFVIQGKSGSDLQNEVAPPG